MAAASTMAAFVVAFPAAASTMAALTMAAFVVALRAAVATVGAATVIHQPQFGVPS